MIKRIIVAGIAVCLAILAMAFVNVAQAREYQCTVSDKFVIDTRGPHAHSLKWWRIWPGMPGFKFWFELDGTKILGMVGNTWVKPAALDGDLSAARYFAAGPNHPPRNYSGWPTLEGTRKAIMLEERYSIGGLMVEHAFIFTWATGEFVSVVWVYHPSDRDNKSKHEYSIHGTCKQS